MSKEMDELVAVYRKAIAHRKKVLEAGRDMDLRHKTEQAAQEIAINEAQCAVQAAKQNLVVIASGLPPSELHDVWTNSYGRI